MNALVPLLRSTQLSARQLDVENLIERWKEGRSPQTLRAYVSDLNFFANWMKALGAGAAVNALLAMPPGEANETVACLALIHDRPRRGARNDQSKLRSLFSLGEEFGYVAFDLTTKNVRSQAYRDTRGPERDVIAALLEYANGQAHKAKAMRDVALFLLLGYGRALRRCEVVGLDLEHFDARGSRLSVLRKGKRKRQWLSLDPLVTRKLQAWIALSGKEPGPLFLQFGKDGRVLAGRRLAGDGVYRLLQAMGTRLGTVIRPHGLRHAAITAALDETNGNVRAAREFSGHASVEVLMKYDDNRKDVGGEVASKVIRRLANLFDEEGT